MKVYRFGNFACRCFSIIIEEDNGEIRVSTVGLETVTEYIAKPYYLNNGMVRLIYGDGSSMPYKNADGTISDKYFEIK